MEECCVLIEKNIDKKLANRIKPVSQIIADDRRWLHGRWNHSTEDRELHVHIWSQRIAAISDNRVRDLPFSGNTMQLQSTNMDAEDAELLTDVNILLL